MHLIRLSVTVICLNEEKNIQRCLESVIDVADEIIVVDSGSTDKTKEICESFDKVKFIKNEFKSYVNQKNFASDCATNDYILSLDADECLSDELKKNILNLKQNWVSDAYLINRLNSYCGVWIRHSGWYPDTKIRLFNREKAKWEGLELHEKVKVQKINKVGHVKGDLLHYTYHTIDEHIARLNHYTTLAARDAFNKNKSSSTIKVVIYPFIVFFKKYFLQMGFLDGYYGFLVCIGSAYYRYLKYAKLRELHKNKDI